MVNINQYTMTLESDTTRLEEIQERLIHLKKLQKIYNCDLPHLLKRRDELRTSLLFNNKNDVITLFSNSFFIKFFQNFFLFYKNY